jgi:hypothetical protein
LRTKYIDGGCTSCVPVKDPVKREVKSGVITTALMVILPKCPFCVLAYSSTLVMCGKDSIITDVRHHQSPLTIALTVALSLIILVSIAFNFRDGRSVWAMAMVLAGSAVAIWSTVQGGGESLYYPGVALIALGVWMNGSLLYICRRIARSLKIPMPLRYDGGGA